MTGHLKVCMYLLISLLSKYVIYNRTFYKLSILFSFQFCIYLNSERDDKADTLMNYMYMEVIQFIKIDKHLVRSSY